jgi:tRNA pseudouridine55 synthase
VGQALGVGGHLTALRRTASGIFTAAESHLLDTIRTMTPQQVSGCLHPVGVGLDDLPTIPVSAAEILALRQGKSLPAEGGSGLARALDETGRLVAILAWRSDKGGWKPEKVFSIAE